MRAADGAVFPSHQPVGVAAIFRRFCSPESSCPSDSLPLGAVCIRSGFGHVLGRRFGRCRGALLASVDWFAQCRIGRFACHLLPYCFWPLFFRLGSVCSWRFLPLAPGARVAGAASRLLCAALIAVYPFSPRSARAAWKLRCSTWARAIRFSWPFPTAIPCWWMAAACREAFYVRGVRPGIDVGEDVVSPFLVVARIEAH